MSADRQSAVLPDGQVLINWDTERQEFLEGHNAPGKGRCYDALAKSPTGVYEASQLKRPKEIENFVSLLDALFEVSGFSKVCESCFKRTPKAGESAEWSSCTHGIMQIESKPEHLRFGGYRVNARLGRGCCDNCESLTETGCIAKPIECALWVCGNVRDYPKLKGVLRRLDEKWREERLPSLPYFITGYRMECEKQWSFRELGAFNRLGKFLQWHITRWRTRA